MTFEIHSKNGSFEIIVVSGYDCGGLMYRHYHPNLDFTSFFVNKCKLDSTTLIREIPKDLLMEWSWFINPTLIEYQDVE